MNIHIDLNEVFSWIGKLLCGGLCLFAVGYPIFIGFAFAGPPDIAGWFRSRRKKKLPDQLDDDSPLT